MFEMKNRHVFLSIFWILYTGIVYGQQLTFRGQPVEKIYINGYPISYEQTNCDKIENFVIGYDKNTDSYLINLYRRRIIDRIQNQEKEELLRRFNGNIIDKNILDSLLTALSTNKPPVFTNINLDSKKFKTLTNKKHIQKMIKIFTGGGHFKIKAKPSALSKGCQNLDTFNLYLSGFLLLDTSNSGNSYLNNLTTIAIKTDKGFFYFSSQWQHFKQPWIEESRDSGKIKIINYVLNFDINQYLIQILPKKFYSRNTMEIQHLIEGYIIWYFLERKLNNTAYNS